MKIKIRTPIIATLAMCGVVGVTVFGSLAYKISKRDTFGVEK